MLGVAIQNHRFLAQDRNQVPAYLLGVCLPWISLAPLTYLMTMRLKVHSLHPECDPHLMSPGVQGRTLPRLRLDLPRMFE